MTVCKGPCKQDLPDEDFGEFYQDGCMYQQARCKMCRRNIPADYKACKEMYKRVYPGDSQRRTWRRMAERLRKKGYYFSALSKEKFEGESEPISTNPTE